MAEFEWARLRRWPDAEAANLFASDAADRLIIDVAASLREGRRLRRDDVVVIGDTYGGLTLAAATLFGQASDAGRFRVHQDPVIAEQALAANAEHLGRADDYRSLPLDARLVHGARLVLLRLPKSLEALDELAAVIAADADPAVTLIAGGMQKHLSVAMNEVLARYFARVDVGHARQKARVLTVTGPLGESADVSGVPATGATMVVPPPRAEVASPPGASQIVRRSAISASPWPHRQFHADVAPGLWVCAHGGAFAGTRVDIGTRFLLQHLDEAAPEASTAVDLASGTGVLATTLALRRPLVRVIASDQSAAAEASARATAEANGVGDRIEVRRENAGAGIPDACADLVLLNPPFHNGAALDLRIGRMLVAAAARILAPGGQLWTVYNSHLGYKPVLRGLVGATRQVDRNAKFTITVSTK